MEIQEHIKYWIDSADEDLISAESSLRTPKQNIRFKVKIRKIND